MDKRVALYARVSTDKQTVDNQLAELRRVAAQRGWTVAAEFVDSGISGAKGRGDRPAFDDLCREALRARFDLVMAWSVDRLGRSLQDLVGFLGELQAAKVGLYLHQQGMDTTTPAGEAMFQMCGVFAQFERKLIQERVKAGLARAKAQGRVGGRPRISQAKEAAIREQRAQGVSVNKIAKAVGCSPGTVLRVLREAAAGEAA